MTKQQTHTYMRARTYSRTETDRQTDRQRDRQTGRETDRQTKTQTQTDTDRRTARQPHRHTHTQTHTHTPHALTHTHTRTHARTHARTQTHTHTHTPIWKHGGLPTGSSFQLGPRSKLTLRSQCQRQAQHPQRCRFCCLHFPLQNQRQTTTLSMQLHSDCTAPFY